MTTINWLSLLRVTQSLVTVMRAAYQGLWRTLSCWTLISADRIVTPVDLEPAAGAPGTRGSDTAHLK